MKKSFSYSTVKGYFLQDEPTTHDYDRFDYRSVNFGLMNGAFAGDVYFDPGCEKTQWQRFENEVKRLNKASPPDAQYKLLYVARHGQGVHNVAERKHTRSAWNAYWSKLEGDEEFKWADALLTELGHQQAQAAHTAWAAQVAEQKMSLPQTYYTSPLTRALETAKITFSNLPHPSYQPVVAVVKEFLREVIGVHTCDRRRSKVAINMEYPSFQCESGFTIDDELWSSDTRESDNAVEARMKVLLDDIFSHDDSTFISFTSHALAIMALLRVLGHRDFKIVTGSTIPILVRAEVI